MSGRLRNISKTKNMEILSNGDFFNVIKHAPLVSIDLIIYNENDEVLLGLRTNQPAKDYLFVPGGRILKDEKIKDAFKRITRTELGRELSIENASFKGVYEHIYPKENFFELESIGTHYIVMGFEIKVNGELKYLPEKQHKGYKWLKISEILEKENVHQNVKNYFNGYNPVSG